MGAGESSPLVYSTTTLGELLNQSLSDDQETREAAEQNLIALKAVDEFGVYLTQILIDSESQLEIRQLASKHLKKYAKAHLCSWDGCSQTDTTQLETRRTIMKLLLIGLRGPDSRMRKVIAGIVSRIAWSNWPKSWPRLLNVLQNFLSEENEFPVDGAMQILHNSFRFGGEFLSAIIDPVILQQIYRVFEAENEYSMEIRSLAVKSFTKIVETSETGFIEEHLEPMIPRFCQEFIKHLSDRNDASSDSCGLRTSIVEAITALIKKLPKLISDSFPQILPPIWKTLINCAKVYQSDTTNDSSKNIENEEIDSDGDLIDDSANLSRAIVHFIHALMNGTSQYSEYDIFDYQWFYLRDSLSPEILYHLIILMKMTDEKIALWSNDPSIFLAEEEQYNCADDMRREIIESVISDSILSTPTRATASALIIAILKHMELEMTMRSDCDSQVISQDWKLHEAFLSAFCLAKEIITEKLIEGTLHFDITAFLENVVLADLNNSESHPILVGRCLCLGGLYADRMVPYIASRFLTATVNGLQSESSCTNICAAIAAKHWFWVISIGDNEIFKKMLRSYLPALFQGLFDLGSQSTSDNILDLVMENLYFLTSFSETFTTSVLSQIYTLIIAAYNKSHYNECIRALYNLFFKKFTLNPKFLRPLQTVVVPKLVERADFDIADILVRHSPQPLSKLLIESLFPAVYQYIHKVIFGNDHRNLENGGKLICTYLNVAAQQVIMYMDKHGKTGRQYISEVAGLLLNVESTDSEALVACEIVILLLEKCGNTLRLDTPDMQPLLAAIFRKMRAIETESPLNRNLLFVWAHLINTQIDPVVNFFSTIRDDAGHIGGDAEIDALAFVVFHGFCRQYTVLEHYERKTVVRALCKILEYGITHDESALHQVVIAELTEEGETTNIPVLVEICRLITSATSKEVEELEDQAQEIREE